MLTNEPKSMVSSTENQMIQYPEQEQKNHTKNENSTYQLQRNNREERFKEPQTVEQEHLLLYSEQVPLMSVPPALESPPRSRYLFMSEDVAPAISTRKPLTEHPSVPLPYPSLAAQLYPSIQATEEALCIAADAIERLSLWDPQKTSHMDLLQMIEQSKSLKDNWADSMIKKLGVMWMETDVNYLTYMNKMNAVLKKRHQEELNAYYPRLKASDPDQLLINPVLIKELHPQQVFIWQHMASLGYIYPISENEQYLKYIWSKQMRKQSGCSAYIASKRKKSFSVTPVLAHAMEGSLYAPVTEHDVNEPLISKYNLTDLCVKQLREQEVFEYVTKKHQKQLAEGRQRDQKRLNERMQRAMYYVETVFETVKDKIEASNTVVSHIGDIRHTSRRVNITDTPGDARYENVVVIGEVNNGGGSPRLSKLPRNASESYSTNNEIDPVKNSSSSTTTLITPNIPSGKYSNRLRGIRGHSPDQSNDSKKEVPAFRP
eukprot:Tbor_TRINITY_DN7485_c0_g1::TRINITY_DN7485_c0_g1_i1::g.14545::m.14545